MSSVKVENVEKNVIMLEFDVEAEVFEKAMQKSYTKNVGKFNIPGFRKGKAPRAMVERYYGEQVLYDDAINIVCAEEYDRAVEEKNLEPVDRPEIDIKEIGSGKNFVFTAKVVVKPEVTLGQYKGIEVDKVTAMVTEDEVEAEIEKLRDKNSRLVNVEDRPVANGDITTIDFEGFVDGVPFEGGKGESFKLTIGSGQFIPGFEDQLIGAVLGAETEVNVTFPEEYHSEELKGKPAMFKVKVNEIRAKELPAVDDEFVKDVSEFDTLDELKANFRKKLTEKAEAKAKNDQEMQLLKKITDNATVEIPGVMVEKQINGIVRDFEMRLSYQGLNVESYLQYAGTDMETFRMQFKDRAYDEVKTRLVLEVIRKQEAIEPTAEDVDDEIKSLSGKYNQEYEEFKKHLTDDDIEYIKGSLAANKIIDFLMENAQIA